MRIESKPASRGFSGSYTTFDLPRVRQNFQQFLGTSDRFFSQPVDTFVWEIVTDEESRSGKGDPADVLTVLDQLSDNVNRLMVRLNIARRTPGRSLTLTPHEYMSLSLGLTRKLIKFEIAVFGKAEAEELFRLITDGFVLAMTSLPDGHKYLEPALTAFLTEHPESAKNVFLIIRFRDEKALRAIEDVIRSTCSRFGLDTLRADDKHYSDDLWDNILIYMYGCGAAIAVFDQINYREFNPNVAIEVGFMLAQCKRVLLLKDQAIQAMPADIVGKMYHAFDTYDPARTVPPHIEQWVRDFDVGS